MMQTVCTAVAIKVAPAPAMPVDQWEQASQYDTLISLFPIMTPTSAFSRQHVRYVPVASAGNSIWNAFERGSSGGFDLSSLMNPPEGDWSSMQLVRELRQLSGLIWQQAAELVGVSAKTLHNWAAGHVIAEKNLRRLGELLAVLRYIDRGYGEANRDLLLNTSVEGRTLFTLIAAGNFELVKKQVGRGSGRAAPTAALPQATVSKWGAEHFGAALSASLDDSDQETILITSTDKRPAKARRKG